MNAVLPALSARWRAALVCLVLASLFATVPASAAQRPLGPTALAVAPKGDLFVACASEPSLFRVGNGGVRRLCDLPGPATGVALSPQGESVYVTTGGADGWVLALEAETGRERARWAGGHGATAPVVFRDGKTLVHCRQFTQEVVALNTQTGELRFRVKVGREPVALALAPDESVLVVAHLLHEGRADRADAAARLLLLDPATGALLGELSLPPGGGVIQDVRISPDGRHAAVTHLVANYQLPTTQIERGWMNTNALTLIDLKRRERLATLTLDSPGRGAANPWGVAWSGDGAWIAVAHAGTNELSVLDARRCLELLSSMPSAQRERLHTQFSFLGGMRRRLAVPREALGPRAVVFSGNRIHVAGYFGNSLASIDMGVPQATFGLTQLAGPALLDEVRRGELFFHSAELCLQGWQSCASCHPGGGRIDGLNWDLLNDGIGNPKNNRSLVYSHRLTPVMSLGSRATAEAAVRAGLKFIQFTEQPEEVARAIDTYLRSLEPLPSPELQQGKLSAAALRGKALFLSEKTGCAKCHEGPLGTDMKRYDVGTLGPQDREGDTFFTPTLVEVWRTAPYLHDGSAATMEELLTEKNVGDRHGRSSALSPAEKADLVAYLKSL